MNGTSSVLALYKCMHLTPSFFWAESFLHGGIAGQVTEILGVVDNVTELGPDVYKLMTEVIQVNGIR